MGTRQKTIEHNRGLAQPKMTVVMVAGEQRARVERNLGCLFAQTALDSFEILLLDITPKCDSLRGTEHPKVRYVQCPDLEEIWSAMAEGVRLARGEIVAFVEDHCFPRPEWAAAVINAYRRPVAMVHYAFTDTQPETYMSRSFLMTEYGRWMVPARPGPVTIAACNNISYRREVLLHYKDQLENWLKVEYILHRRIRDNGGTIWLEPQAVVAHEDWLRFSDGIRANGTLKRAHAGFLACEWEGWSWGRRIFYAAAMAVAPALHLWRLASSLWNRPSLWLRFIAALPVTVSVYCYASYQEAMGYLWGPGSSLEEFGRIELSLARKQE